MSSESSTVGDDEGQFGRQVAVVSSIWIAVVLTASALLILYSDTFAGLFF